MKTWKICSAFWNGKPLIAALLLGALLIIPLDRPAADSCGPSTRGFKGYTLLNPHYLNRESSGFPAFTRFQDLYRHFADSAEIVQKNDNISEWVERTCRRSNPADVHRVVYKTSVETLELLRSSIMSPNMPLPYELSGNSFARYLKRHGCVETAEYLIFAKRCEPHVAAVNAWEEKKRDAAAMEALIEEGIQLFLRANSDNIRLRYAYQIVRLAHYAKLHARALELFDFLMPKLDVPLFDEKKSIIYYWALGHKAGALRALGENPKAAYLFSRIFEECPSRRASAYQSFYLKTDEEWTQCLLLCQSDQERANLYAMRGAASNSKALEEMEKIYELDPRNENLELLLIKEIQELEKDLLGLPFNNHRGSNLRNHGRPRPIAGKYVIDLHKFARQLRAEAKVARPEVWHLAEGYLELLAGDYYAAERTFQAVEKSIKNPALKEQLQVFLLARQIASIETLNDSIEELGYKIRRNKLFSQYLDLPDFLRDKFSALYQENDRPGKAFRSQYSYRELRLNPQEDIIKDLLAVAQKTNPNSLEVLLIKDEKGVNMAGALYDMWATILFQNNQLEAALRMYQNIPYADWDKFGTFHPFRISINDCVHCPQPRDTIDQFNKGELFEALIDLEYKARAEIDNNAVYLYRIGVALYNCSYFGHSWQAMDYFRSGATWDRLRQGDVQPYLNAPFGNKENLNLSRALEYLEKARDAAQNPELAARAAFMAAKCERRLYYMSETYQAPPCCNQIPLLPEAYARNYQKLKKNFSDTRFYQEIIKECQYFRAYALK